VFRSSYTKFDADLKESATWVKIYYATKHGMLLSTVDSFSFGFRISVFFNVFSLDLLMLENLMVHLILFGVGFGHSTLFSFHCLYEACLPYAGPVCVCGSASLLQFHAGVVFF
jgi:hypothetical protein